MGDDFIVTAFVVVDKTMQALGHRDDVRARASDAEVLTVAIVAARYFQSHLARALQVMHLGHYWSGPLSASRFNRRLHGVAPLRRLFRRFRAIRRRCSYACRSDSDGRQRLGKAA